MGYDIAAKSKRAIVTCIRIDGLLNHMAWGKKVSLNVTGSDLIRWSLVMAVLEDRETHQIDFPGGFKNTHCGCDKAMCQTSIGGLWKINMIPDHKPAKKQGLYKHKELNSANNWWAWERTLSLRWAHRSKWLLISVLQGPEQSILSHCAKIPDP